MKLNAYKGSTWTPVYAQLDLKYALLKIKDGTTPTPLEITVKVGEGNLTWSENRNIEYVLDRGLIDEVREGDQVPMDVSFDFTWEFITGNDDTTTSPATVEDALKRVGQAAGWISTDADQCRPYAVDIVVEYVPNCSDGSANADQETITLPDFRWESVDHDLRAGTISVTGRCNAFVATTVREAQP
ncbi:hypothetical protein OAF54_02870 [bacterium]|nr:hypothetical protein [bacterium]